ncbi:MAG TPA: sugar phosphate nucleotidyltransferase [Candidatus Saccharimonadales bacterium]|nr:sugar phosphate nucleotidyltransferase [Candidatus Saccharimonadales bacterium]
MKERLTITLDSELLKKLDATIDGVNVRNRSHAIERLLDIVLEQTTPKKAVILAGGEVVSIKGQNDIPKPMLMVNDRPILEYVIRELKRNEIIEILIAIGRGGEKITSYFGDGSLFGVKLNYIKEDSPKGTANALDLSRGLVGGTPFFVLNGDNIFRINLIEMYKQHITTKAQATIALSPADITTGFGVTSLDGLRITSFLEKPEHEKGKLVSAGIYLFNTSIFDVISSENTNHTMLEKHIFPKLANAGKLYGYAFSTPWYPLDSKNISTSIKKLEKVVATLNK